MEQTSFSIEKGLDKRTSILIILVPRENLWVKSDNLAH